MNEPAKKEINLENERVLLRPLAIQDLEHLLPFAMNEPELWTYSLQDARGEENMRSYVERALRDKVDGHSYPFIVFDKQKNAYAGSTRFYDIQKEHKTLQLGYTWYGKEFQRTGLNTNCKYLMLDYAFSELDVERVEFRADAKNKRSINAMKGIGCTVEGILRSNCNAPDGRRDSIILSILKNEWTSEKREALRIKAEGPRT